MSRRDEDEVLATRVGDVELLRVVEEAERAGLTHRVAALRHFVRQAEFRQRTALGITVRRRAA